MANYELMLILNPNSEEDRTATLENLDKMFQDNSVNVVKKDVWGDKKLAYKINSSDRGFYILFDLELDGKVLVNFTKSFNLDKTVWRHMFVKKGS